MTRVRPARVLAVLAGAALLWPAAGAASAWGPAVAPASAAGIGPARLGLAASRVPARLGPGRRLVAPRDGALEVRAYPGGLVVALGRRLGESTGPRRVQSVWTTQVAWLTRDGVHVGLRVADVRRLAPRARCDARACLLGAARVPGGRGALLAVHAGGLVRRLVAVLVPEGLP